jgi:hypothetical protein
MFNEWWKLPMQIAMGLVLSALIQAVAVFVLRAISGGKFGG